MQSKAIGESMKAFFVNSMSLSKLGAPLEELKEKLGFEERRGYIDFGEFYAVCGKLRPIDELRRENNRAFSKAFDDKVPKHMDTDEIILDYFWRNVIIDEAYRLSMISASKEK